MSIPRLNAQAPLPRPVRAASQIRLTRFHGRVATPDLRPVPDSATARRPEASRPIIDSLVRRVVLHGLLAATCVVAWIGTDNAAFAQSPLKLCLERLAQALSELLGVRLRAQRHVALDVLGNSDGDEATASVPLALRSCH